MDSRNINSKIQFYIPEIILFILYFFVYCFASAIERRFLLNGILLGSLSFIFFIIEHKTDLILDKINNLILVREKMLFVNKYIIKAKYSLSDISKAEVVTLSNYNAKEKTTSITYKLRINFKDRNVIFPFGGWSDSNYNRWQDMVNKINSFNQSQEPILVISRNPFFFRYCFGITLGFLYFLSGLGIIFPKETESIIYNTLNLLFSINGYHQ